MNPTEKGFPVVQDAEAEPPWIRNPDAAIVEVDSSAPEKIADIIAAICDGEMVCCEYCGWKFPLWPPIEWADHVITVHGPELTIMVRTNTSLMCSREMNVGQQMYFSVNFASRVAMRRRAWKLGFAVAKPGRVQIVQ
jgi:hypothetical protein